MVLFVLSDVVAAVVVVVVVVSEHLPNVGPWAVCMEISWCYISGTTG